MKKLLVLYIDSELIKKVKQKALMENKKVSWIAEELFEKYVGDIGSEKDSKTIEIVGENK